MNLSTGLINMEGRKIESQWSKIFIPCMSNTYYYYYYYCYMFYFGEELFT